MKKLLLILVFASIFTFNIDAQSADRKWAVGLYGGSEQYSGDLGNGWYSFSQELYAFGELEFARYLTPHFDVALQGSMGDMGHLSDKGHVLKRTTQFNFNVRYNILDEAKKLNPYVFLGVGAMRFKEKDMDDKDNWALPSVGFGLTYKLSPVVYIRFQENFLFSDWDGIDGINKDANERYLKHSLGVIFNIGKAKDTDGDGVSDNKDECPEVPGLVEFNGCPDSDGDGIVDSKDDCPNKKGLTEFNGCPDTDGDGIVDSKDACPKVKGLTKFNGCPDTDGDGIADSKDDCPKVKGLAKFNGCPDTDGDGIADKLDKCPKVKGHKSGNGCPDRDGDGIIDSKDDCPDIAGIPSLKGCPKMKEEKKKEIEKAIRFSAKNIQFSTGKSVIRAASYKDINKVIEILNKYPKVRFDIEGHTDNTGNYAKNKTLSQKRADAVKSYILGKGVPASRLRAIGYGSDRPIDSNKTRAGRQNNRRVEFIINQ